MLETDSTHIDKCAVPALRRGEGQISTARKAQKNQSRGTPPAQAPISDSSTCTQLAAHLSTRRVLPSCSWSPSTQPSVHPALRSRTHQESCCCPHCPTTPGQGSMPLLGYTEPSTWGALLPPLPCRLTGHYQSCHTLPPR